jgi:hypothetical protein
MNVDYFSYARIEFLVSQIHELIEIKMIVAKPDFRRQTKRKWPRARLAPQLLNKALVTRRAVREVPGNRSELVVCQGADAEPFELRC